MNKQSLYSLLLAFPLCVVVFNIQGCGPVIYSYPESWPPPVSADGRSCQSISGTYKNDGDSSKSDDAFLFDMITNEGLLGTHECTSCTVTLAWSDTELSELSVVLYDSSGLVLEKEVLRREKGDFSCENGAVVTEYVFGFEAYVEGFIQSGTRRYYLAVEEDDELLAGGDNWLIQEQHSTTLGHWLVVPLGVTVTEYFRWLKMD